MTEEQAFYEWSAAERGNISVQDAWLERASRDRGVELAKLIVNSENENGFANHLKTQALIKKILKDAS